MVVCNAAVLMGFSELCETLNLKVFGCQVSFAATNSILPPLMRGFIAYLPSEQEDAHDSKSCTVQAVLIFPPSNREKPSALTASFDLASLYAKYISLVCVSHT